MQWLGPLAGSVLTLTWASRVILDLTHQGPEDLSPELLFSFRSWGRPHPQLCLVGRGPQQVRGLLAPRRLPCRYLQLRPPRPSQSPGGSFPSPADVRVVPAEADSAFPSSGRGSTKAVALPGPDPLRHSRPCAVLRFHVTFWSLPLAVRRAPPARPRLSGQPERRPPRTGVRRAAPPGLGPRGPGSS